MKRSITIFAVAAFVLIGADFSQADGWAKGEGYAQGKGVVKGEGTLHGTGVYLTKDKDGNLKRGRIQDETVSGRGIFIGKGTVKGKGKAYGKGRVRGKGKKGAK